MPPLTVAQFSDAVKSRVEGIHNGKVSVVGEVAGASRPVSGHVYFSLKDKGTNAQVPCVMFRNVATSFNKHVETGKRVVVTGKPTVYEPRGTAQIIIAKVELVGEGEVKKDEDELKARLKKEGLFDDKYKKPIPGMPWRIGLITSPRGAAKTDFLRVLHENWPSCTVRFIPALMQGTKSPGEIAAAFEQFRAYPDVDVIVLTRGGGSSEDLAAFNDEMVVRSIFDCQVPVMSAVGHEIDFTLTDFVADARAQTPTKAAEALSKGAAEWRRHLNRVKESELDRSIQEYFDQSEDLINSALPWLHPDTLGREEESALLSLSTKLDDLSPESVLDRGYTLVEDEAGQLVTSITHVKEDERVFIKTTDGEIAVIVEGVDP